MIKDAEFVLFHSNQNRTEADFHKRGRLSPGPASQGWDSGTEPGVYFLFSVLTSLLFSFIFYLLLLLLLQVWREKSKLCLWVGKLEISWDDTLGETMKSSAYIRWEFREGALGHSNLEINPYRDGM